jgi:hypothetical protein
LYNEGYYSESQDAVLREDLCLEAMRLTYLLFENEKNQLAERERTSFPDVFSFFPVSSPEKRKW